MKIAEFTASLSSGGAEVLTINLSLEFKKRGHDVKVIIWDKVNAVEYEQKSLKRLKDAGIEVFQIGRPPRGGQKWPRNIISFIKLIRYLQKESFDLVHTHTATMDIYAGLAKYYLPNKTKLFFTVHTSKKPKKSLVTTLRQWSHKAGKIVYCSKSAYEVHRNLDYENSIYIDNGVPLLSITHADYDSNIDREKCDTVGLIAVGRMHAAKNHECMIRSMAELKAICDKKFVLKICGGGDFSNLEALARQLGVADVVEFLGVRSDVYDLLAQSDIFVSTSLWEGMPLTVLEAFQSGIPCVVSPIQEHLDIAEGIAGCVIAEKNEPQAFAEAIVRVYDQRKPHGELRDQRQSYLDHFSIETCASNYLNAFAK